MKYTEIVKQCEQLEYRDKLRLSQLLIQLARKEEEIQNPKKRSNLKQASKNIPSEKSKSDINTITYVVDRIDKLRPAKKRTLLNCIKAMYQFQGGISEKDQEKIVNKLEKANFLKVEKNNRIKYLNDTT
ncbi:MAG: hypothetical protein D3923_06815 [Candidatus Electrothrix sp. AR3]|nr:hypothetical protein [Candidatus Electrothrix sp. AR3]